MISQDLELDVAFSGSPQQQDLAAQILTLMRASARFMAATAPIRIPLEALADYLAGKGVANAEASVRAALAANPTVFALEEHDGAETVATTRIGRAPRVIAPSQAHSLANRFMTPQPKPEKPTLPVRERLRVEPRWATLTIALEDLSEEESQETVLPAPELLPEAPVAAVVAEPAPVVVAEPPTVVVEEPPAVVIEEPPAVVVEEPTAVVVEEPAAVIVEEPIAVVAVEPAAVVAVEPEIVPEPEPEPVKSVAPPARTITIPVVATTDVTGVDDLDLAAAIRERLTADTRVANFGEQWMMEDRVPRFSRGDLRRMKDYLQEQERPLPDDVLAQDVLNVRPGSPEFDLVRFAINYRLSHEHRDFEFVGSTNQRYWSTSSLSPIGTGRRKPNELGSDYRFLLEETPESIAHRSIESVDHVLTFFEYLHGLLPYDAELQKLTPGPMLHGQRAAVLTFECPQSYTTYLVELRYPTPNRGGFILGLDDFYGDNLVPGAVISISATENDGHYRVEFLAENPRNARLLELDERRSAQRYVFRPTTYSCGVDEGMLLTEERFGGLNGEKPLDDKVRRRPESVVAATFERVGDRRESNYSANFDTLLAAVNVERPMSATLLRSVLENDDTGAFSHDPEGQDDYTYVPGATP